MKKPVLILALLGLVNAASAALVTYSVTPFNTTITGAAPTTSVAATRPTTLITDSSHLFSPASLGAGGSAKLELNLTINGPASAWNLSGNLFTMGLQVNNGITNPFNTAHDDAANFYVQTNQPDGSGLFADDQFFQNGVFAFGGGNGGIGGVPFDNATQTAPQSGLSGKFTVELFATGAYTMGFDLLDADGDPVLFGGSQSLTGSVADLNSNYLMVLRYRDGFDQAAGRVVTINDAMLTLNGPNVVAPVAPIPEPTTALFGAALLGIVGCARRRK